MGARTVLIDGAVLRARAGENDLVGVKVNDLQVSLEVTVEDVAIHCSYETKGFTPVSVTNAGRTAFVGRSLHNAAEDAS